MRKEIILLALVAIYGANLPAVRSASQFVVLAQAGTLYLPSLATISILAKEFDWKTSVIIDLSPVNKVMQRLRVGMRRS